MTKRSHSFFALAINEARAVMSSQASILRVAGIWFFKDLIR
jgi:hypothetical protein